MFFIRYSELITENEPKRKTVLRHYPNGNTSHHTFNLSDLHCPKCGNQAVWVEDSPGDYYVGPGHRCGHCAWEFYLPWGFRHKGNEFISDDQPFCEHGEVKGECEVCRLTAENKKLRNALASIPDIIREAIDSTDRSK